MGRRLVARQDRDAVLDELVSYKSVATLDHIVEGPLLLVSTGVEKMHDGLRMHVQKTLGRRKAPTSGVASVLLLQKFRALHRLVVHGVGEDGRPVKTRRLGISKWRKSAVRKLAGTLANDRLAPGTRNGGGGLRPKTNFINKQLNKETAERNYARLPRREFLARRNELSQQYDRMDERQRHEVNAVARLARVAIDGAMGMADTALAAKHGCRLALAR